MRRPLKFLAALVGATGAVILLAVARHYQLRAATAAYIAQLKSEGVPVDLESVVPTPVPPDKNGADLLRQATPALDARTNLLAIHYALPIMKMVAPGKAMACWQQPDVRGDNFTDSWQQVALAIAQNQKTFDLLHQLINKPDFDFHLHYERGIEGLDFPRLELNESKKAGEWLAAAAVWRAQSGDTAAAVDDVRAALALTEALRDERFAISDLVRIAIAQIAVGATWEILQSPACTDEQLARLQRDWTNLDFIQSGENDLAMERAASRLDVARWRASPSVFASYLNRMAGIGSNDGETFLQRISAQPKIFMWKYWWSYPDELGSARGYEVLRTTLRMAQTNGSFEDAMDYEYATLNRLRLTNVDDDIFSAPNLHSFLSESIWAMQGYISRIRSADVAQTVVTTAIALKRYYLKHGNYPPHLDALVSEYLPAIPLDPVDGKPLRYRPEPDGSFLLYSVGPNGTDDGGNPALEKFVEGGKIYWLNNHALDWVWPRLATDAEIRNYRAHPLGGN